MFVRNMVLAWTIGIVASGLTLALILVLVQLCVFKAGSRILSGLGDGTAFGKKLRSAGLIAFGVLNVPLGLFILESLIKPRSVLFYAPPIRLEGLIRPISYVFFVWTIGSVLFVAACPVLMGIFALIQFSEKRRAKREFVESIQVVDLSRRRFVRLFLAGIAAVPFAASAYGAVAAKRARTVETVDVPIDALPGAFDGLKIVQLSDIHAGLFMSSNQIRNWVGIANGLNPDIIVLTGDFVASRTSEVSIFMKGVSGLRARYGVYGCLGNHDMFTDSEATIEREFQKAGFVLLRNRNQYIDVAGTRLNLIGVDFIENHARHGKRLNDILARLKVDSPNILLCHNPNLFEDAARSGIDLMLSGHTHGGQIALKLGETLIAPARLATMFIAGLFKIGQSHLYVNRGLGTTGPPIRINAPPEVTVIRLRAGGASAQSLGKTV
ncbi:MAG TPA: metallophosphoesterase [Blastocatellia bacterium]|nr:metallophosphoesterase [Blastocatellia bacterium]